MNFSDLIYFYSEGRHLAGYREGDDEDDKYFCPETGAHFEYSEAIRKLRKLRKKRQLLQPQVKNKLSLRDDITKSTLDPDLKWKEVKNTNICNSSCFINFLDQTQNSIGTILSTINNSKDFDLKSIESMDNGPKITNINKDNSYQDQFKIWRKNNLSQLSKLGNNFATEDLRKNVDIELAKKQTSPLDIYGESATFDEFWKSINGKFNTSMMKGAKNKRILIPKNSIKTPSKSTENKVRKGKKRKGAESWRIEKYLKNVEKFSYPGSSLSIQHQDSTQFATIDSNKMKIFKKNKIINTTNLSKKIKKRKETKKFKSGEYQLGSEINITNCKDYERLNLKGFLKTKRKSTTSDAILPK